MTNDNSKTMMQEMVKGLWEENPTFRQLIGMCPPLAITTSVINGIGMGIATTFVLIASTVFCSLLRKLIPNQVRIAIFTIIIAVFVTITDYVMAAYFPVLSEALGPYIPLIIVNCIILGRIEAFASKNTVGATFADAVGMGVGFTLALMALGAVRELIGTGCLLGFPILGSWFEPWIVMILPAGAFISLGLMIGLGNWLTARKR